MLVELGWSVGIPKVKLERHKYFSSFALNSKFGISALPDFPTRLFISTSPAIMAGQWTQLKLTAVLFVVN